MTHEQAQNIMELVEQHRQRERQVANRYMVVAAMLGIATLAILYL